MDMRVKLTAAEGRVVELEAQLAAADDALAVYRATFEALKDSGLEAEARWRANGAFLDKPDPATLRK